MPNAKSKQRPCFVILIIILKFDFCKVHYVTGLIVEDMLLECLCYVTVKIFFYKVGLLCIKSDLNFNSGTRWHGGSLLKNGDSSVNDLLQSFNNKEVGFINVSTPSEK